MNRKVWMSGATGYLGSAIAARLARTGLEIHGLARDARAAGLLETMGVKPVPGDLSEPGKLLAGMKNCDVVVHVALDPSDPGGRDQAILEAVREAAHDGRVRRLLYTSGVWVHGDTGGAVADETAPLAAAEHSRWRPAHEQAALDLAEAEVVTVVLRPGMVYGGRGGAFGGWFDEARSKGTVTYPGDGSQHWGTVHRDDMAEAYALALEHGTGGEHLLLVDGSRHTVREMAEAVARAAGARAVPSDRRTVLEREGTYGAALLMDQQFTGARARRELGWVPRHAGVVAEAEAMLREWREAARAGVG